MLPGIGTAGQRSLLRIFGTPLAVFQANTDALASVVGAEHALTITRFDNRQAVDLSLEWAQGPQHRLLTLGATDYPRVLLELADPPNLLYAKGNLKALENPCLAIVGSRNATAGGLQNAERFSLALAESGYTIVSGLALGIDTAAHQGALTSGRQGATIAIIGTGIDRVYPARNQPLARRIVEEGSLILSEFPLGIGVQAHHFPRRNRLISGLSRGVLVVEAATESGSLITARLAGEQGRDVFAIPGSIHSPQSRGCHRLIRDGAKLVESANDIIEEVGHSVTFSGGDHNFGEAAVTDHPVLVALGGDPVTLEELATRCDLTSDRLLAMLFELELGGRVAALPGGRYQRLG